jgi:hypothetical protein
MSIAKGREFTCDGDGSLPVPQTFDTLYLPVHALS